MSIAIDRQDGLSSATAFKGPCRVATTANISLAGEQTVDGVSVISGNRVLVRAQTNGVDNGIYVVDTGNWRRAADFGRSGDVMSGTRVGIVTGSTYAGSTFQVTTADPIYIGTTAIAFALTASGAQGGFVVVADNTQLADLLPSAGYALVGTGGIAKWTSGDFSSQIAAGQPAYVKQTGTAANIGAWVYAAYSSPAIVDRTRPLVYEDFYRWKGNHNDALTESINAMYQSGSPVYRSHVDLKGARIILEEPVTPTGGAGDHMFHILNGRIEASTTSWAGGYLLDYTSVANGANTKLLNVSMFGNSLANWVYSDGASFYLDECFFLNNKTDLSWGFFMDGTASLKIAGGTRFQSDEGASSPNVRTRAALKCVDGDQKIDDAVFQHFKYGMWFEGYATTINKVHVYQGVPGLTGQTSHTAGIKFPNGRCGAMITNLYLDKCFIEMSNEADTTKTYFGELNCLGIHTALDCGDSNFAFIVARDYGSNTTCYVSNVTITGSQFRNSSAATVSATKIYNPANFDTSQNDNIFMGGNDFVQYVTPQSSRPTMKKTFTASTQHSFDFTGYLPFGSQINNVVSVIGKPSSGGGQALDIGAITPSTDVVRIDTASNWAGDITVTATVNKADANGNIQG